MMPNGLRTLRSLCVVHDKEKDMKAGDWLLAIAVTSLFFGIIGMVG
jgi:hypothetical protein